MTDASTALARFREVLRYDRDSGIFYWLKSRPGIKAASNMRAGCKRKDGYVLIRIDGVLLLAHRLAWLFEFGEWPKQDVDHINGTRSDNRIVNLRDVSRTVNLQNQRAKRSDNGTGALGVTSFAGRFIAHIQVAGKTIHIGCYATLEAAHQAYLAVKRQLHEGCTI